MLPCMHADRQSWTAYDVQLTMTGSLIGRVSGISWYFSTACHATRGRPMTPADVEFVVSRTCYETTMYWAMQHAWSFLRAEDCTHQLSSKGPSNGAVELVRTRVIYASDLRLHPRSVTSWRLYQGTESVGCAGKQIGIDWRTCVKLQCRLLYWPVVSPCCLTPETWCSRWNFTAIMHTSRDICNFLSTSG